MHTHPHNRSTRTPSQIEMQSAFLRGPLSTPRFADTQPIILLIELPKLWLVLLIILNLKESAIFNNSLPMSHNVQKAFVHRHPHRSLLIALINSKSSLCKRRSFVIYSFIYLHKYDVDFISIELIEASLVMANVQNSFLCFTMRRDKIAHAKRNHATATRTCHAMHARTYEWYKHKRGIPMPYTKSIWHEYAIDTYMHIHSFRATHLGPGGWWSWPARQRSGLGI